MTNKKIAAPPSLESSGNVFADLRLPDAEERKRRCGWPSFLPLGQPNELHVPEAVGRWFMDATFEKTFRISESKAVQTRFDTFNILNHPRYSDAEMQTPNQTINTPRPAVRADIQQGWVRNRGIAAHLYGADSYRFLKSPTGLP